MKRVEVFRSPFAIAQPMTINPAASSTALFRERLRAVSGLPAGDKLLAGPRLFDRACGLAAAGLRHRHPEADESAIRAMIVRQLSVLRRLEGRR